MPFPVVPVLLGAGALGAVAYVMKGKKVPLLPASVQPQLQQTNPAALNPGLDPYQGSRLKVGDKVMVDTMQPNGSHAHLIVLITAVNGSTLTVSPADDPPMPPEWGIVYPPTIDAINVIQKVGTAFSGVRGTPFPPGRNAGQGWGLSRFGAGLGQRYGRLGYDLGGEGYGQQGRLAPFAYGRAGWDRGGKPGYERSWHVGASSERYTYDPASRSWRAGCAPSQMGAEHAVFQGTAMGPEAQPNKMVVGRNPWLKTLDKFSGGYDRPYEPGLQKMVVGETDPVLQKHMRRGRTQGKGW